MEQLWCHAKDAHALRQLVDSSLDCFSLHDDNVVLTSRNYLWTFPGEPIAKGAIAVLPERNDYDLAGCGGICTDFPKKYKEQLGKK
jgi:hypothetical protein